MKETVLKLTYSGRPASFAGISNHNFVYLWKNCGNCCASWCASLPYSFCFPSLVHVHNSATMATFSQEGLSLNTNTNIFMLIIHIFIFYVSFIPLTHFFP